jgi:hypothetical protein
MKSFGHSHEFWSQKGRGMWLILMSVVGIICIVPRHNPVRL